MDITKSSSQIKSYKYLNGETVNYAVCFTAVSFIFLVIKQLLKVAASLSAGISVGISAVICAVVLFFLEKKYVFNHVQRGKLTKQSLIYVFRCAVDFGFYKIASFVFVNILKSPSALVFFLIYFIYLFFNYYFDRLLVFDCIKDAKNNYRGRCYKTFWNNRFVVLSVILTGAFLALPYLIFSVFPFGDVTIMRMDLYHQYGPLFVELYDRVVNHESMLYSWISGGGSSFLGNYFNYLSSPLTFIIFLFDRKEMTYAITTIVTVKGILSALTFSLYLKYSLKRHSIATSAFGVFYALSAYFLAYYWNVMWLDGMVLFPIVMLGIEKIINECKPLCYIASLTVLFFASYYMAYMTCIFSVVYFCAYFILRHDLGEKIKPTLKTDKKYSLEALTNNRLIKSGLIFTGASLLSALLCAVSLVPVYMILQNSAATSDSFPKSFELYHDILSLVSTHFSALETTIRSSGDDVLPNVYCGLLTLILLPLFITNKKISVREKTVYIAIVLFFFVSFNLNIANFIWHAFHYPNDLPYRFSFMYSFILLVIAFRTLMNFKHIEYRDIAISGMFWVFVIIILQKYMTNKMDTKTIYFNIILIAMWTALLLIICNKKLSKNVISLGLIFVLLCEMSLSIACAIPFSQKQTEYVKNYDTYREAISKTYDYDDSFYRLELSELNTRMDACLYGYRGMSTFSSMAYEDYSGQQYSLGMFGNRINSYTYYTQTPVYNMFYSLKYIMKTEESLAPSADFYEKRFVTSDKKCEVYENKYFLPVAFTVDSALNEYEIEEGNPFEQQSALIENTCKIKDIYIPVKYTDFNATDVDCEEVDGNGTYYFTKEDSESNGSIDITVQAVNDSNLYIYLTSPEAKNVNYYWGDEKTHYQNIETPYILDLGKHKKGEEIKISIDCAELESDSSYFDIYAYNIDYDKLVSAHEFLDAGKINVESFSDTGIKGTVNAGYNGYLYTSIPYDKGWSVYIDGVKQKTVMLNGTQLACEITKGEHKVEFKFMPQGLLYGAAGTAAGWTGIILYALYKSIKKKKKKQDFVEIV